MAARLPQPQPGAVGSCEVTSVPSLAGTGAPGGAVPSTACSQAAPGQPLPTPPGWDRLGLLRNRCLWGLENNPALESVTCVKHLGS